MCSCAQYEHIEFRREAVRKRIKESRALKQGLNVVAKHPAEEHRLYQCDSCGQLWQGSRARNWGNDEYLFRVPPISATQWLEMVFVQPDALLVFTAVVADFLGKNTFAPTSAGCAVGGCDQKSVTGTATCLRHHVEALQRIGALPPNPDGRWFEPYVRADITPLL